VNSASSLKPKFLIKARAPNSTNRPVLLITDFKKMWEDYFQRAVIHPDIMPETDFPTITHNIFEPSHTFFPNVQQTFPKLWAVALLQLKTPLSPKYFYLNNWQHILSSSFSTLKIHLANKHLFITLVLVKPKPRALFGEANNSQLAIWYFFWDWAHAKIN
jgi:hypothetical protein